MDDSGYEIRCTRLTVSPPGEPIFSEQATDVEIVDEAAGEFLQVRQKSGHINADSQTIQVSAVEWPALSTAIERMLLQLREPLPVDP